MTPPTTGLFPLREVTRRPVPDGYRGALVREVSPCPGDILRATWHPTPVRRDRLGPGASSSPGPRVPAAAWTSPLTSA
ncbi:hypothetical protein ABT354_16960 [Streptomyces sp. NPDC000594]|uniref:hypothetical protein n=1 Tax=Streptomyces sp. NPDC000594 TaxID=3154261 RepID=UPI00331C1EF6